MTPDAGKQPAGVARAEGRQGFRSLFENMHEGLALCQMIYADGKPIDWVYLDVNAAFESQTGLEGVVGRRVSEVIPGLRESDPDLFATYGRVAAGGPSERFETHVAALDMWFSVAAYCPAPGKFMAVFDVITERVRAERALRSANALLSRTESVAHVGSWRVPLDGGMPTWSAEMYRIFGLDPSAAASDTAAIWQKAIHPDDAPAVAAARARTLAGEVLAIEYRIICPNGDVRWLHGESEQELDEGGSPIAIVGFVQDVTDRKNAEASLAQSQKMEAIGRLAGGVAHDFNNLLTAIGGYARLLESDLAAGSGSAEDAAEIRRAADRAAVLTARLLAFAGRQDVRPEAIDLSSAVNQMLPMLRRMIPERIQVVADLQNVAAVEADPGEVDQIILNLAINAADAIPDIGRLSIETEMVEHGTAYVLSHPGRGTGPHVRLRVSDTGIGMDEKTRSRIFEPFFSTKPVGRGTGLGLATVYGVVTRIGGSIEVNSATGLGTVIEVDLPSSGVLPASSPEPASMARAEGTERIMLVEDEDRVRQFTAAVLARLGYAVLQAASPGEALRVAPTDYDVLVTDVVMPDLNGAELARKVRDMRPDLPVLFMSGYSHGTADLPVEPGFALLAKPFTPVALGRAIRRLLERV